MSMEIAQSDGSVLLRCPHGHADDSLGQSGTVSTMRRELQRTFLDECLMKG